jgi:hypothetical protein
MLGAIIENTKIVYEAHKTGAIITPEKPQRIKEIPNFADPKIEEEHMFNMVVNCLQLFDEQYYSWVEGEVLYFPLRIVNHDGNQGSNMQ